MIKTYFLETTFDMGLYNSSNKLKKNNFALPFGEPLVTKHIVVGHNLNMIILNLSILS